MIRTVLLMVVSVLPVGCVPCHVHSSVVFRYQRAVDDAAKVFYEQRGRWPDSADEMRTTMQSAQYVDRAAIESIDVKPRPDGGATIRYHVRNGCPFDDEVKLSPTSRPYTQAAPLLMEREAQALVCELPSVQAFRARVEKLSGGRVHTVVMTESATADLFDFYVGEDHDDHTVCWNRFSVDRRTRQVRLIDS